MKFLMKCSGVFDIKISRRDIKSYTYGSYLVSNNLLTICAICFEFMQFWIFSFEAVLLKTKINFTKLFKVEQADLFIILFTNGFIIFMHR